MVDLIDFNTTLEEYDKYRQYVLSHMYKITGVDKKYMNGKNLCDNCINHDKCKRWDEDIKAVSCSRYWKKPTTIKSWLKWFYVHKIYNPYRYYKYTILRDKLHIIK